MASIQPVTEEKYKKKGYYRFIINLPDKDYVAFGYNALVGYLGSGSPHAERIRNELAQEIQDVVERRMADLITAPDGLWPSYLRSDYLPKMVLSDMLRDKARAFYKRLTLIGRKLRP